MQLSEHFTYNDGVASHTAKAYGLDNAPNPVQLQKMEDVCEFILEPIYEFVGGKPKIESFLRVKKVNAKTPGASLNSQHINGEAVDLDDDYYIDSVHFKGVKLGTSSIKYNDIRNSDVFYFIAERLDFDQVIWEFGDGKEPGWVHVSYVKGANEHKITLAHRVKGKVTYTHFKTIAEFDAYKNNFYGITK